MSGFVQAVRGLFAHAARAFAGGRSIRSTAWTLALTALMAASLFPADAARAQSISSSSLETAESVDGGFNWSNAGAGSAYVFTDGAPGGYRAVAFLEFFIPSGRSFSAVNLSLVTSNGFGSSAPITFRDARSISVNDPNSGTALLSATSYGTTTVSGAGGAQTLSLSAAAVQRMNDLSSQGGGVFSIGVTTTGTSVYIDFSSATLVPVTLPVVASVAPNSGPTAGGTTIVVTGTTFTGATAVSFGATPAASFTVNSATQITATTPARAAGIVDVTVTTPNGTSATSANDRFTFSPPPTINAPTISGGFASVSGTFTPSVSPELRTYTSGGVLVRTTTPVVNSSGNFSTSVDLSAQPSGPYEFRLYSYQSNSVVATRAFTYTAPPSVGSLGPNSGGAGGGTPVSIFGTNFTGATSVVFGSTPATNFVVQGDTQIIATSPAGSVGSVNVRVTTPGGTSSTNPNTTYTYVAGPTISSVSPAEGIAHATTRPADVTIVGSNFSASGNTVNFGGTPGTIVSESTTSITVTPPANSAGGQVNVDVFNAGGSGTSAIYAYRYILPPVVTVSFDTSSIVGTGTTGFSVTFTNPNPVAIRGARVASNGATTPFILTAFGNFCGTSGNYNASSAFFIAGVDLPANGSCTATSTQQPTAGGAFQFVTAAPTATGTATTNFTLTGVAATSNTLTVQRAAPSITSVSPSSGPQAGGTNVTLTGSNLTGTTAVTVGGFAATNVTVVSDTQVTFTTGAASSPVFGSVVATNSVGIGARNNAFTYIAAPVVSTISPAVTSTAGGATITLNGSGLGSSTVTVDGVTVGTIQNTGSLRSFAAPAHAAGTVNVVVTTGGGSTTAQLTYVDRPTANAQTVAVPYGTATGVTVTGSDPNTPPQSLTYSIITPPTNGFLGGVGPTYTYTPMAGRSGSDSFTFVAQNGGGASSPATVTLNIGAPTITLTPTTVPDATAGVAYSQTLTAGGGAAPYAYAVTAGALPAGLTLSTGGVLSGTPGAGGTFNFSITATDSSTGGAAPFAATRAYSLTVQAPTIVVSPNTLPGATRGVAYSQTVTASGGVGAAGFAVTAGALPGGLTLSPSGVLSGTPSTTGSFSFTITATDQSTGAGPYAGSRAYSLTVGQGTPVITGLSVSASHQFQTTPVTITGSEFTGATSVLFGTAPAASFTVVSDTRIDAIVPVFVPSGVVNVSVTAPGGTSADSGVTDDFRFIGRPLVTSVSPSAGGTPGGASLRVSGQNFTGATSVFFSIPAAGGASNVISASSFVVVDDATLTVVTPTVAGIAPNGAVAEIVVANPSGEDNAQAGPQDDYTFVGQPSVAMLDVTEGPLAGGTRVTVTGQRLGTVTGVTVGGVAATNVVAGAASVAFDTPAGTGVQPIVLTWTYGVVSAQSFSYLSAPSAPQIVQAPPSLSASSTAQFTLSGVSIQASLDGGAFAPIAAQPVIFTGLTDGSHVVRFRSSNAGGTSAEVSHSWTIDTVAPAAPVVATPVDQSLTSSRDVVFSGAAEVGATVTVSVDSVDFGSAQVGAAGTWSFPRTGLTDGMRVLRVQAVDAAGNASPFTTVRITVDATAPAAPIITTPTAGSLVTPRPTLTGSAEAGATVTVQIDGAPAGTVTATGGLWSFTVGSALADGPHAFRVTATDAAGNVGAASTLNVTVDGAAPVVLSSAPQAAAANAASATFVVRFDEPVFGADATAFALSSTGSASGTIAAVTTAGADVAVTVTGIAGTGSLRLDVRSGTTIADARGTTGVAGFTAGSPLTVDRDAPLAPVVTAPLDGARVLTATPTFTGTAEAGVRVSVVVDGTGLGTVTATGGAWSFTPSTGLTIGAHVVVATATDAAGNVSAASSTVRFTYNPVGVNAAALPNARVGTAYSATLTASGGTTPYAFSVVGGTLPDGIVLSTGGALSGTPTISGTFGFTVRVTDAGGVSAEGAQTLVVDAPAVPDARPTVVTVPATSTTGPTTIDLSAQTANAARIEIVTPPAQGSATVDGMSIRYTPQPGFYGTVTFTYRSVGYANGGQTGVASAPATVTVTLAAPTLVLAPSTLPAGRVAVAYAQTVSASGGTAPYAYALTGDALPAGLTLSAAGVLSGAPTAGGTFNFTVTATDSSTGTGPFSVSQSYALTVAASTIVVSPASLPAGTRGTPYSASVSATGGVAPYAYAVSAGALPTGLTLSTAGVLSGTPTAVGSFTFTVTARDSAGGAGPYTGSATYTVTISALTLTVTPTALPPVLAGTAFSQQMSATGGRGTYAYAVTAGALPSGLTLTTGGLLSGRPAAAGTFAFTITATDGFGNTGSAALTLTVTARPDPAADPDVQGLTTAEADAARRISQSQIGNFTRRLEQIRRGGGATGGFNVSLDGSAFMSLSEDEAVRGPLAQVQGGQGRAAGDRFGASGRFDDREALRGLLTAGAPDRERVEPASAVPTDAAQAGPGGIRVWAGGAISLGERDATTRRAELDIRTGGLSVGADMSVSDQLDVGVGVGFGQEDTDVGSAGTRLEAETWVGVGYLTWRPDDRMFVDGILGYGSLSYDTRRRTSVDQSLVFGERDGDIVFGSVTGGIDRSTGRVRWSVYGRAEGMTARLDAFTETGSALWALSYDDRSVQSLQGVLGVRWERDFGVGSPNVWSPGLRFELSNEFADAEGQTLRYADWLDGPSYGFDPDGWSRTQAMLGLSLGLTGEHGWSVRGEAEGRTRGDEVMAQFRMLLSRKF